MPQQRITPVHYRILVKVFKLDGFAISRYKGDHIIMTKMGVKRPLVVKTRPPQVPVTHIRTNLVTAGTSREQYFKLLERGQVNTPLCSLWFN